jgi:site-specific DNA recombinase
MARIYREQVADLRTALVSEDSRIEATEIMRSLIERIELAPDKDGKGLSITLRGALGRILRLAINARTSLEATGVLDACTKAERRQVIDLAAFYSVAGVGFEPTTFRL